MTAPRRNPAAGIAAGVALAALAATPALAQSQDAGRTLANGESIVIDGRTFSITPGTSKNDLASPSGQPGARRLGAGVVIFRSGDGLYMVDRALTGRATPPSTAGPSPPCAIRARMRRPARTRIAKTSRASATWSASGRTSRATPMSG